MLAWIRTCKDSRTCLMAAEDGEWEVLEWALDNGFPCDKEACVEAATKNGHEFTLWIIEQRCH